LVSTTISSLADDTFNITSEEKFNTHALKVFEFQAKHVPAYREYIKLIKRENFVPDHYSQIPFLPVSLFKNHIITSAQNKPGITFTSSGTTGQQTSTHYVHDINLYRESLLKGFELFYGSPENYCFLALLPSYLERSGSSLVYMANELISKSANNYSGFYLRNYSELSQMLLQLAEQKQQIFLLGVTFALLDLFEKYPLKLPGLIIMETGGMKGQRKELIRSELHEILKNNSGALHIHSEYGMTELLSQAYSIKDGIFYCPPWMQVLITDIHDPFSILPAGQTGIINVIDFANIHSCSFIATQDLGRKLEGGGFEVLGRMDHSELRGCNLMVSA
jgi:phenylacetate-coenzyme A ligase PaaK-like adenylate-forming protein